MWCQALMWWQLPAKQKWSGRICDWSHDYHQPWRREKGILNLLTAKSSSSKLALFSSLSHFNRVIMGCIFLIDAQAHLKVLLFVNNFPLLSPLVYKLGSIKVNWFWILPKGRLEEESCPQVISIYRKLRHVQDFFQGIAGSFTRDSLFFMFNWLLLYTLKRKNHIENLVK